MWHRPWASCRFLGQAGERGRFNVILCLLVLRQLWGTPNREVGCSLEDSFRALEGSPGSLDLCAS